MKVHVALEGYEHEGYSPIGVFKTKEGAQKCCDEHVGLFDDNIYGTEEFELGE